MKVPSEVPVANPLGSLLTEVIYSKYSSTEANSGRVSGVSIDDAIVAEERRTLEDGAEETEKAEDRAAAITESIDKKIEVYRTIWIRVIS